MDSPPTDFIESQSDRTEGFTQNLLTWWSSLTVDEIVMGFVAGVLLIVAVFSLLGLLSLLLSL
jgi:hypothetical protein